MYSKCGLILAVLAGLVGVPPLRAQATHVITPHDIAMLRQVSDAQIAPDGRRVIYSVRTPDDPAKLGPTRLWSVAVATGARAELLPGSQDGDGMARWSPDSRAIAFVSTRPTVVRTGAKASSVARLWIASPYDAPAHPLGHLPGAVSDFRWSPDGRWIAALVQGDPVSAKRANGVVEVDRHSATARIYLVDVANGAVRAVTSPDMYAFDADWAPDGKRLVVRYGAGPGLEYFWYRSQVAVMDMQGRRLAVLPHHATAVHPSFSPDGRRVVYGYFNANGITGAVASYDLSSGRSTLLGQGWKGSLRALQWNGDGRSLTALGFADLTPWFVTVDATSGKVVPRLAIQGDLYDFSRAANGTLAYVASTRRQPDEVWAWSGEKAHVLTDTNPQVAGWRLGKLETVQWRSHDGTLLRGLLMLPAGVPPGKPVKTLVQIHGGPLEAWPDGWQGSWANWAELLAAHGYAVFMPNPRGSDGEGDAFATAVVDDWGGKDFQDILDGVAALEARGIVDPNRMAIGGWSYGGYMSAWAAGHSDPFKAAIDGAGITDIASMAMTTDVGYSFIPPYFGDPVRERARYAARSPITYVHDVHMPVLILHGGKDTRVPVFQGEMFYNALRQQGTPVEMVCYPGAPHWFGGAVGPAYEEDVQQRVLDWLDRYLGDSPVPLASSHGTSPAHASPAHATIGRGDTP